MPELNVTSEARRDAARAALQSVFGNHPLSALTPVIGGVSGALIFRFQVQDRPYVLRIEPERVALHHRERGFACMTAAAAEGAAPRLHHADPVTGVAIMDFVSGRPLSSYPGGAAEFAKGLGTLVAKVQAAPLFPRLGDYPDVISELLIGLKNSPRLPPGELEPHADGLALIRSALPWYASSLVPSHNDPNPRNILFDGERLWLIDWELASRNDPLVDLAILSTEFAETPDLEDILVSAALGVAPDPRLRARLHVIRLLTRLFYGCIVLDSLGDPWRSAQPAVGTAFTPAGFRRAVAEGRLVSGAPETAHAFAQMSLAAFLDGIAAPGFKDALKLVEQG
ncbi:phosphotransferase [Phenylobacterium sp.]|uniref:phosphotransferase n=1 Tax=Phenylobacterium sp. TaxID=1871053 RepID=UPI002719C1A9|nr:phosphotransferase [Phenylobacterium sp.]MDO8378666.1 phosphotransferase [Phenylobacterium sp.]